MSDRWPTTGATTTGLDGLGAKTGTADAADELVSERGAVDARLINVLAVVVVLGLPVAWWLSLHLLIQTPIMDLTPPKVLVVVGLVLALLARPWQLVSKGDALSLALFAAYAGWFILASAVRGSAGDLKMTVGYAIFLGAPMLAAYVAARVLPTRTCALLIYTVLVALGVTLVGVLIERFTYPGLDQADPLAALWSVFRPQGSMEDAILGTLAPPPLHFPTGDPMIPRVAAWFAHVNYLAFFAVLAGILGAVLMLSGIRRSDRQTAAVGGTTIAAASLITAWTYSRVGLVGLPMGIAAALVVEVLGHGVPTSARRWAGLVGPAMIVGIVLGGTLLVDQVGLRRIAPPESPLTPGATAGEQAAAIEASAERSTALRLTMQRTALAMITETPAAAIAGPGQRTFETAVHTEGSPRYVADAIGVRDPNSLWLSVGLSGGIVGLILLLVALAVVAIRLLRVVRSRTDLPGSLVVSWLAAWLATWAAMQFFGTYPFATAEAVILGTLLGVAIGMTTTGDRIRVR
jgi:hypothetical protein